VDMENPIDDIVGLYSELDGQIGWYPDTVRVNMEREDIDGNYTFMASGGGGVVFLNEEKQKILKVNYNAFGGKEVIYQKKVGAIAPQIFYDDIRKVGSDNTAEAFGGIAVQIIIMEYLNPDKWVPLRGVGIITYRVKIFELIYTLINDHNIKNVTDLVGQTGSHIWKNKDTEEIKVIDYGEFKESTDPKYDFIMMVDRLQYSVIQDPTDEIKDCYKNIMDFSKEVTNACKGYLLEQGRTFWEKKNPRRSQRISSKSKYGLGISGTINKTNKTRRGGTSKRKNSFRKNKRKSKRRKNKGLRKSNGKGNGKRGNKSKSKRKYRK